MNHRTAAFYTLGCKLNFSETSTIARDLEEVGFARIEFEKGAEFLISIPSNPPWKKALYLFIL